MIAKRDLETLTYSEGMEKPALKWAHNSDYLSECWRKYVYEIISQTEKS